MLVIVSNINVSKWLKWFFRGWKTSEREARIWESTTCKIMNYTSPYCKSEILSSQDSRNSNPSQTTPIERLGFPRTLV